LAAAVANNEDFLRWTKGGLVSTNPHNRDLAIVILENTTSSLFEARVDDLSVIRDTDQDLS
jgi:hypothetical protein